MRKQPYHYKSFFALVFVFQFCLGNVFAQTKTIMQTKTNINDSWLYLENNTPNLNDAQKAAGWSNINLPHSWNSEDATDLNPGYRRDASWYQKKLNIAQIDKSQRYFLYFEGSNVTTKVYVNGTEAGGHIGGYIGFTIDVTNYIKPGNNDIFVRIAVFVWAKMLPRQN